MRSNASRLWPIVIGALCAGGCRGIAITPYVELDSSGILHPFIDFEISNDICSFTAVNLPSSFVEGGRADELLPCVWVYAGSPAFPFVCTTAHSLGDGMVAYVRHSESVDWIVYSFEGHWFRLPAPHALSPRTRFSPLRSGCTEIETSLVPGGEVTMMGTLCLSTEPETSHVVEWQVSLANNVSFWTNPQLGLGRTEVVISESGYHAEYYAQSGQELASIYRTFTPTGLPEYDRQVEVIPLGTWTEQEVTYDWLTGLSWIIRGQEQESARFDVYFSGDHMFITGPLGRASPFSEGARRTERQLGLVPFAERRW